MAWGGNEKVCLRGRSTNTVMSWEVASSQHLVSFSSEQLSYSAELKLSCPSLINLETQTARKRHACSAASCAVNITIWPCMNTTYVRFGMTARFFSDTQESGMQSVPYVSGSVTA